MSRTRGRRRGDDAVTVARLAYALELRFTAHIRSAALVTALASVPRERFVGPGPWRVKSPMDLSEYWTSGDADPASVYHDVLIALDETKHINNGQPSLWAFLLDQLAISEDERVLHLGCGTGYYTAVMAELVGASGHVTAIEIDAALAERAREALAAWPQVRVLNADGAKAALPPSDLIVVSAGATHPLAAWLDALAPEGRLMLPLTTIRSGPGQMLLVSRLGTGGYAARFLHSVGFIDFAGARDQAAERKLSGAFFRSGGARVSAVRSLRRDAHAEDDACWLHGEGYCLSLREPEESGAKGG